MSPEAHAPDAEAIVPLAPGDTSLARSSDPCTSIVTLLRRRESSGVTRSSRYRGRANLRKQKEPAPRSAWADDARLAACHRFLKRSRVMREKRKEVAASVPARIEELGSKCPHVGNAVAEVGRRRLASNTLTRSAPKRVAAGVNGGLARGDGRR